MKTKEIADEGAPRTDVASLRSFLERRVALLERETSCGVCGSRRARYPIGPLDVCGGCRPAARRRRQDARLDAQIAEQRRRANSMRPR